MSTRSDIEENWGERPAIAIGRELQRLHQEFMQIYDFQPGDLIEWKCEQLRIFNNPRLGEPVVFISYLAELVRADSNPKTSGYAVMFDAVAGALTDTGDFLRITIDSTLFKPWRDPEKNGFSH